MSGINFLGGLVNILQPIIQKVQTLPTVFVVAKKDSAGNETRKPFPQFNQFRQFVIDELMRRKTQYPTMPSTPFVRMTSTCEDDKAGYQFFSLGLHGYDAKEQNIFDLTYSDEKHDIVGTAMSKGSKNRRIVSSDELSLDAEFGSTDMATKHAGSIPKAARPVPGITSVSIKRMGLGQPIMASVQWSCYNRGQLEFLRNHFLIPGNYVILEIGQNFANQPVQKMLNFAKPDDVFNELMEIIGCTTGPMAGLQGRDKVINEYSKPNKGNYDVLVGQVGNFEIAYEPETNIYKCTTSVISQGENIWGIKIDQTMVQRDEQLQKPDEITTIKQYFESGMYDMFINKMLAGGTVNAINKGRYKKEKNDLDTSSELQDSAKANNISVNVNDYVFLTWDRVFADLIPNMLEVIKDESIRAQLLHMMDFGDQTKNEYVGYHEHLLSSEPESLLLINKSSAGYFSNIGDHKTQQQIDAAKKFYESGGTFGPSDGAPPHMAKFGPGMWINSGMIRECFMDANDIRQAITSILLCMNRAVGNYWQLQLYYDEDTARYKIIDYKAGDQSRELMFYKFNAGAGTGRGGGGECLSVEFDSAFPPELVSQMMLVGKWKSSSKAEQERLVKQYPLLGTTSAHMFVLNWSTLRDGLQERVQNWRTQIQKNPTGDNATAGLNNTAAAKLDSGAAPSTLGTTRKEGDAPGDTIPMGTTYSPAPVKTDTKPISTAYKLARLPVDGTVSIVSAQGPRIDPISRIAGTSHNGIDIDVDTGTAVYATNPGIVERAETNHPGYGGVVYVRHYGEEKMLSLYGHLSVVKLKVGDPVHLGTIVGLSGGGLNDPGHGKSTGAHLHFEMRQNSVPYSRTLESLDSAAAAVGSKLQGANPQSRVAIANIVPGTNATTDSSNQSTTDNPTGPKLMSADELAVLASDLRRSEVISKFGSNIFLLTELNRSDMINRIATQGYKDTKKPNSFVAPYPTTTSVTVEILGIAGISVSDGFFVDKIPFTFENHGVFQVTEVTDTVGVDGWRTKVRGYFKMLWYDAAGGAGAIF